MRTLKELGAQVKDLYKDSKDGVDMEEVSRAVGILVDALPVFIDRRARLVASLLHGVEDLKEDMIDSAVQLAHKIATKIEAAVSEETGVAEIKAVTSLPKTDTKEDAEESTTEEGNQA